MFVDASAIVAILGREPGYEEIERQMTLVREGFAVSPLVKFEAAMALARIKASSRGKVVKPTAELVDQAIAAVEAFVEDLGAETVAISDEIGQRAMTASSMYGRTVGHPADLNFGDCFAYACAKALALPLLYKGDDFSRTDLA